VFVDNIENLRSDSVDYYTLQGHIYRNTCQTLGICELCYCQRVMVGNDYTDKLICRGYAEREGSNDDFD